MAWMKLKQRGCWKNMVLLIDANILLDVLLAREEFLKESSLIWKLCETGRAVGYIHTHHCKPGRYHAKEAES